MKVNIDTPLSSLLDRLLRGEVEDLYKEELYSYLEHLTHGDKKKLQQALEETKTAINKWRDSFFIPVFEETVKGNQQGTLKWSPQELDDLFYEEEYLIKEGKTRLTRNYLYDAITNYGFINGHQEDAVSTAWAYNDIEFLQTVWEDFVLAQIRSLQEIITSMLTTTSTQLPNDTQTANRPFKKVEDYPEVFGIKICSELTGYSVNTLYKLTSSSGIPCFRAGSNGRTIIFKLDEVVKWMTARRQETTDEYIDHMGEQLATQAADYYNNPKKFKKHD